MYKTYEKFSISYKGQSGNLPPEATIPGLFFHKAEKLASKNFISCKDNNKLVSYSWQQISDNIKTYAQTLSLSGIQKNDLIAIISEHTPEHLSLILAILASGAICCPLHNNLCAKQIDILNKTYNYRTILCSDLFYDSYLKNNISDELQNKLITFSRIIKNASYEESFSLKKQLQFLKPDDIAYIMLSSGTTGLQKGILLTHDNILSNIRQLSIAWPFIQENDQLVSHLPLSHSYGGLSELYQSIYHGASYHMHNYISLEILVEDLIDIQPAIFHTVPRIWEKLIEHKNTLEGFCNLKAGFSAGAPLDKEVLKCFLNRGIKIYQGYGLTEASPSIAIASPEEVLNYNKSRVLPLVDLKISEESEILVKGPNVSAGYFNTDIEQCKCYQSGYLKTGDLGILLKDKTLRLTGRKNDIIILSTGKKILPDAIEKELSGHPAINFAFLTGNNKSWAGCIIIPDKDYCVDLVTKYSDNCDNLNELLDNNAIIREFQKIIDDVNISLAAHEQVKKFILSFDSPSTEEFTPTFKLKRRVFEENRKDLIQKLYG
jgi:long-chain acyl-CoA synthetase